MDICNQQRLTSQGFANCTQPADHIYLASDHIALVVDRDQILWLVSWNDRFPKHIDIRTQPGWRTA